jgi:hypothetical protein
MNRKENKIKKESFDDRVKRQLKERSEERFYICVNNVMNSPIPEVYASAVISFGRRAGMF